MSITAQIAKHLRDVHFGLNWTWSNLRDQLSGLSWQQANTRVHDFNTIVALVYHIHYFVHALLQVMKGGPLDAHDKYSFDHPPIQSAADWEALLDTCWAEAEQLAQLIEHFPDERLHDTFVMEKYGTYYRNFHGLIEHAHYHLGQIVLIKKLVAASKAE
ncbi:MAG TPA: DinB family protein [Saprospiraceae bacterium]|nr:DinB family protein [Saprospiraceae bacterium]